MTTRFQGLIAAAYTSFHSDLSVDYANVATQLDYLLATGVRGVLVGGTTGEGSSLTTPERKRLAEAWKQRIPSGFPLIIHVGHNAYGEVNNLARHTQEIGANSILLSAPTYLRAASVADLIRFHQQSLVGIDLPVYYYHIPSVTGVTFSMADFLKNINEALPTFRGIKFTHEDLDEFARCQQYQGGAYEMIFGRDELLLDALKLNGQAALGSTYNFMAPLYNNMIAAYRQGQLTEAQALQEEAVRIIEIIIRFGGGIIAGKAMMQLVGIDCGPLRPPLVPLTSLETEQLAEALDQTHFYKFTNQQPTNPCIL